MSDSTRVSNDFPAPTYADVVLAPAWQHAQQGLLESMIATHRTWAVMLAETELLDGAVVAEILTGLDDLDLDSLGTRPYDGRQEDLFFAVEHELAERTGTFAAGSLHLARSRNDLGQALYRMALRDRLLDAVAAAADLYGVFRDLGEKHATTIMLAHTHTQPAQPTTLGHWVLAAADMLERSVSRLEAAYATVNRSPLGGAALAGTGFAIDRDRAASLLGFEGIVENSYDAIAGADYFTEAAAALELGAIDLGRVVNYLLRWSMAEHGIVRLGNGYVQVSSIMPQKRNPVGFEHARGMLSRVVGDAGTVRMMVHNTPFGDINDTEDDLQPPMWRCATGFRDAVRLLSGALAETEIDVEHARSQAAMGFSTATQLADQLVVDRGLAFRDAHHIAAVATKEATAAGHDQIDPLTLDSAVAMVLGEESLGWTQDDIDHVLDPEHFIEVRRSRGGVAPPEVRRMAEHRVAREAGMLAWLRKRQEILETADEKRARAVEEWQTHR